jgi:hypothetical protein
MAIAAPAQADITVSDTQNVYTIIDNALLTFWSDWSVAWTHNNPFPGDYDAALAAGDITGVSLTLVVEDLDLGDAAEVFFQVGGGPLQSIGYLNTMAYDSPLTIPVPGPGHVSPGEVSSTTFNIPAAWLAGTNNVKASAKGFRILVPDNVLEIETSELAVTYREAVPVPVPSAIILGAMGLGLVGWIGRKRLA